MKLICLEIQKRILKTCSFRIEESSKSKAGKIVGDFAIITRMNIKYLKIYKEVRLEEPLFEAELGSWNWVFEVGSSAVRR